MTDATLRETFGALVGRLGHEFTWAGHAGGTAAGPWPTARRTWCCSTCALPDGYGLSLMAEIKAAAGAPEVIIITGQDYPEGAALAIKSGAWDYIQKPDARTGGRCRDPGFGIPGPEGSPAAADGAQGARPSSAAAAM